MKNNHGITIITLVITIIVIVLIASITIYTGVDMVENIRTKEANDTVNAIYLALIANEDNIPSGLDDNKSLAEHSEIMNRVISDQDFELMELNFKAENCNVILNKYASGDNITVYNFVYTNEMGKVYDDFEYEVYVELNKYNTVKDFDTIRGVNRPILCEDGMVPINKANEQINNVYTDNWYIYDKDVSEYALMTYNNKVYAWIPRFAYKIQDFYLGKSYKNIPRTAIDIVFLREDSDYMANGEVLQPGYVVHPAFSNGLSGESAGFWIMINSTDDVNGISDAIADSKINGKDGDIGHLMKNSEYAAVIFLSKYLNNNQVIFDGKEYTGSIYDSTEPLEENLDYYSSNYIAANYIGNIRGHAMSDTPWDLKKSIYIPDNIPQYVIRDYTNGGPFYFELTDGKATAACRSVIAY